MATALGVPAPVVLAGVLGAAIAVGQSGKFDWHWGSLAAALMAFAAALGLGILGGPLAGHVVISALSAVFSGLHVADEFADPLCTLLVSMFWQSQLLPLGLSMLRRKAGEGAA